MDKYPNFDKDKVVTSDKFDIVKTKTTKGEQVRVNIDAETMATVEALTGGVLSATSVASLLLHASAAAIREAGGNVVWPPKLKVQISNRG